MELQNYLPKIKFAGKDIRGPISSAQCARARAREMSSSRIFSPDECCSKKNILSKCKIAANQPAAAAGDSSGGWVCVGP